MSKRDHANSGPIYDELTHQNRGKVQTREVEIQTLQRKDAETTFQLGDAVKEVQSIFREESFRKWCDSEKWEYSFTYAYDLVRVVDVLGPFRERLVAAKVLRTSLIDLSSSPEHVEQVLELREMGQRLAVAHVKRIIAAGGPNGSSPDDDDGNVGGEAGMKRLHRVKGKLISGLVAQLRWIAVQIEQSLEATLEGRRVLKGRLVEKVLLPSRQAHRELESLCLFVEPHELDPSVFRPTRFPEGSRWRQLADILFLMGGRESWPSSTDLEAWLRKDVVPVLRWATGNELPVDVVARDQGSKDQAAEDLVADPLVAAEFLEEQDGSGQELPETGRYSSATDLVMETFARSAFKLDMRPYQIRMNDLFDGMGYEIRTSDDPQFREAVLRGDCWLRNSSVVAARDNVDHVRLCEGTVRKVLDFLLELRGYGHRMRESEEAVERVQLECAAVFAEILVCLSSSLDPEGRSASARRAIRDALHRDCLMAAHQQQLLIQEKSATGSLH